MIAHALLLFLSGAAHHARYYGTPDAYTRHFLFSLCRLDEHLGFRDHMAVVP